MQKIQIIKKKIDEERLSGKYGDEGDYYQNLRYSIKKSIKEDADIVVIDLIPKQPLQESWLVECLLDLQSEFTKVLLMPKNLIHFDTKQIEEIKNHLKANEIMKSV